MKVVAIVNPISGAGADAHAAERRAALLSEGLERRGHEGQLHFTERAGHAHELAAAAARGGAHLVIVWGGDGTVNEAGAALLGTRTALGVVPAGSGNGLAGSLGCPREPRAAIAAALDGRVRAIDAGVLGDRPFFNVAGVGVDARIAALFNLRARGTRGRWPYILIGIREGLRYAGQKYDLQLDDEPHGVRALLVAFANGREYGNSVRLSASAELDDGLLEATIVEDRSVLRRFWDARRLARVPVDQAPRVMVRRIRRAVVRCSERMEYHVDGEPGTATGRLDVSIRPRALLVKA